MATSNHPPHIYLVMDGASPMAAFTLKSEMRTYLRRRHDTFNNPLIYTFGDEQGHAPAIITVSAALADA